MIKHLKHILKTKGPILAMKRLYDILARFLLGRRRFGRLLLEFDRVFGGNRVRASFFVTAALLERHLSLIRCLQEQGHCLGVHGYYHIRMDRHSAATQSRLVKAGIASFRDNGLETRGFRPPYLNYNKDTQEALLAAGYKWTSCRYLLNSLDLEEHGSAGRLRELYHISRLVDFVSIPFEERGLIDIPITGPDDELMVDRYRITDPEEILEIWIKSWREVHLRGELYHLMFHPERFLLLADQAERLIEAIHREGGRIWTATLGEIAEWWEHRGSADFTVDIDGDDYRVFFRGLPDSAAVLLSSPPEYVKGTRLMGCGILEPLSEDWRGTGYVCGEGHRRFVIGMSGSCSEAMEKYLRNEGFITMREVDPDSCSLWLEGEDAYGPEDERRLLGKVEACPYPLVRLWRWPGRCQSAVAFSADICAVDVWDFAARSWHFHKSES